MPATIVFYEAPHRLAKSLADCNEILGNRRAVVAREITKIHEEIVSGGLDELGKKYAAQSVRGEIVLVIDRNSEGQKYETAVKTGSIASRVQGLENDGVEPKTALKMAAKEFGLTRSEAYRRLQFEKANTAEH
jgi:16S rRNA (cytidine1402-2'-O)-methyltransferase